MWKNSNVYNLAWVPVIGPTSCWWSLQSCCINASRWPLSCRITPTTTSTTTPTSSSASIRLQRNNTMHNIQHHLLFQLSCQGSFLNNCWSAYFHQEHLHFQHISTQHYRQVPAYIHICTVPISQLKVSAIFRLFNKIPVDFCEVTMLLILVRRGPQVSLHVAQRKNNNTNNDIVYCTAVCFTNNQGLTHDLVFSERLSLNAVNNFVDIWFEFCCRQPQNWTEILLSVKFDLSLFLFMFIIENICSHKYVLPNSDNNRQAKSLTLPYVLELRLP